MRTVLAMAVWMALSGPAAIAGNVEALAEEVRWTEIAFAKTMADRDHAGFQSFLADETVFFSRETMLRGKAAVAEHWKRWYQGPTAPFSWAPDAVSVLESGTLGLSSGPVFDPSGLRIGTFSSVWRREPDGKWRIVFDKGCPACDCDLARPLQ